MDMAERHLSLDSWGKASLTILFADSFSCDNAAWRVPKDLRDVSMYASRADLVGLLRDLANQLDDKDSLDHGVSALYERIKAMEPLIERALIKALKSPPPTEQD